jgi:hypothetical protein
MTTHAERQVMVQEVEAYLGYGNHVMTLLERIAKRGEDREAYDVAMEVGVRQGQLRGTERIAALVLRARTWPESASEHRARQEAASAERRSEVGESLATRNERRRQQQQQQKITENFKPSIGWNVPPEAGKTYGKPDGAGYNTPIETGQQERRGFNRIRSMFNKSPEDAA